ncbi:MAG: bifunctional 5,10-methylenetetrahydrofolate dehydrogenase/5,10-methenyltetrahydrofolate cyclohydrolase [Patescibacteria group bacterium]
MKLLYSKLLVEKIEKNITRATARSSVPPAVTVLLVGNDAASLAYVRQKERAALRLGCEFRVVHMPGSVSEKKVLASIASLNKNKRIHGVIVQLPLPRRLHTDHIVGAIAPHKDIDNLRSMGPFTSPAVLAIWHIMKKACLPKKNTSILIIGHGRVIGKPVHEFLLKKGFSNIRVATKTTNNLSALTRRARIVISAAGKARLVTSVQNGALVIDAGASRLAGRIVGDVDATRIAKTAAILTPVPGGVGPLTVAYLFNNLVQSRNK